MLTKLASQDRLLWLTAHLQQQEQRFRRQYLAAAGLASGFVEFRLLTARSIHEAQAWLCQWQTYLHRLALDIQMTNTPAPCVSRCERNVRRRHMLTLAAAAPQSGAVMGRTGKPRATLQVHHGGRMRDEQCKPQDTLPCSTGGSRYSRPSNGECYLSAKEGRRWWAGQGKGGMVGGGLPPQVSSPEHDDDLRSEQQQQRQCPPDHRPLAEHH